MAPILVLGVAACATTTAAPPPPQVVETRSAAPPDLGGVLARAGQPGAPTLAEMERTFGEPDLQRREGAGAILTYRLDQCALVLVFAADGGNAFRLAEASAQAVRPESSAPALADCAAAVHARAPS